MKQECRTGSILLGHIVILGLVGYFVAQRNYLSALLVALAYPAAMALYIRAFPAISRYLGYGSVADQPAGPVSPASVIVTYYGAVGCPFCPIVKQRLHRLRDQMGFRLEEVDVTLHPEIIAQKKIYSVPVVETPAGRIVGHATTRQLADLILAAPPIG